MSVRGRNFTRLFLIIHALRITWHRHVFIPRGCLEFGEVEIENLVDAEQSGGTNFEDTAIYLFHSSSSTFQWKIHAVKSTVTSIISDYSPLLRESFLESSQQPSAFLTCFSISFLFTHRRIQSGLLTFLQFPFFLRTFTTVFPVLSTL